MALTKPSTEIDPWTAVAQDAIGEGNVCDLALSYESLLFVDIAMTSAVAHTGTQFIIRVRSGDDKDHWHTLQAWLGPAGTPATENLTDNPLAADATTINMADTTGFGVNGRDVFIKDATLANSELVLQAAYTNNTDITILTGTQRSHVQNTPLWNLAVTRSLVLPLSVSTVRVICDNTHDSDGASCAFRSRITKVTALT